MKRWIILLAILLLLIAAGHYFWTRGVYISITNSTKSTLDHVEIKCHGGVIQIAALEPNLTYGRYINPTHGTDLKLEWIDSSGVKHSQTLGVYMEHNYTGSVLIKVEPNNTVSIKNKVDFHILNGPLRVIRAMGIWFFVVVGVFVGIVLIYIWTLGFRKHYRVTSGEE